MKIAILSRSSALYSTQSLVRACLRKGHEVEIIDHMSIDLLICEGKLQIKSNGLPIGHIDAIIPRIGSSVTSLGTSVIRQFEMMGVFSATSSDALTRSRDKLSCLQYLASQHISIPDTMVMNYLQFNEHFFKAHMKLPVIVKLLDSTHGLGVMIANSSKSTETILETLYHLKQKALLQQFIRESAGSDIRVLVVDGRIVAAMQRQGVEGEFRSNLHRGGTARMIRLTPQEQSIALRACEVLGLGIAGVDILRGNDKSYVLEVNASPGLEGIEGATGVNVAARIVDYVEKGYRLKNKANYANRSV
ncbi:RimK family alpha-L-glutamate ligase [Membranicola marinus]|uniref:RimK family alpha-L-glutamate ligase n=1 Tax=Membranihabitans marinus TaxID=1227546 RepID=A0A953HPN3_9BACT|nr:RimK family alpha-L-glutamate ligase [Membranihabitans marinus]MBY5959889.1 RimK family alpha-L-glutamate ligase [Membranihabitans marinus]